MTDEVTWYCVQFMSLSAYSGKLHNWWGDLKMCPVVSLSLCFLGSFMTDEVSWKCIQDVSINLCLLRYCITDKMIWNVFRNWVCLCQ
jgi:hypothetical protein